MLEDLRPFLYYPLGLLPSVFFTLRILVQWFQSEKRRQSYTGSSFWRFSLAGNILLLLHYTVQVQYPFAMLQAGNAIISWRNLDLMKKKPLPTRQVVLLLIGILTLVTAAFVAQGLLFVGHLDWMRTPVKLFDQSRVHHHFLWHLVGAVGGTLFASRFWIQWWQAEWRQRSELGTLFWWVSIIGSSISLTYFIHIGDNVSIIHYGFGLIPYVRNLMLIRKARFS